MPVLYLMIDDFSPLHDHCFLKWSWIIVLQYELLFCIENNDDPAIMIVRGLLEKYPKVDAHLFVRGKLLNNVHLP